MKSTTNRTRVKAPDLTHATLRKERSSGPFGASDTSRLAPSKSSRAVMTDAGQTSAGEACSLTANRRSHQLDLRKSIKIATWNVLTLARTGYLEGVVRELNHLGSDIACLTETRLVDSAKQIVEDHTFLHSGGTQHYRGVGLLLSPRVSRSLIAWTPITDRLLSARLSHHRGHVTIIAAYAPTEVSTDTEKDDFYTALEAVILSTPPHDQLLVAGDLNAVTGLDRSGFEKVIGPFGSGVPNDNTARLLTLCAATGLSVVGSWFRRSDIKRWSWISNDGVTRKEIDHILTRNHSDFISYRVFRGAECPANTDHRLIMARLKINLIPARKPVNVGRKLDTERLTEDIKLQKEFAVKVQNRFDALTNLPDDVEQSWLTVRNNIMETASLVIGHKKHKRKPWLSDEAFQLIALKSEAVRRGDKVERNRLKRVFRAKALSDREQYYNNIADQAEEALQRHNMKPIYGAVKTICGLGDAGHGVLPNKLDGTRCKSDDEALARWIEHYKSALNHPPAKPCDALDDLAFLAADAQDIPTDAPTLEEVLRAIRSLKNGRSPGSDGITSELLKHSINTTGPALHRLFSLVWKTGKVPAEWRDGIIVSLYKGKGSKAECSSYRPITLLSVPGKVFAHVLLSRIEPLLMTNRRPQQSGFTAGRSTSDAILALRLLSDLHREFNQPLFVAYVDLKSAFDSVDREALWKAMRGIGTPTILLNLMQDLYGLTSSQVRLGAQLSPSFQTKSGVRQGCVLAPALFCRAVDWILHNALAQSGSSLSGEQFTDTDYADDIAAIDNNLPRLVNTLEKIESACSELGLHISWSKTKIQNVGTGPPAPDVTVLGQTVEGVDRFTYLGSQLCSSDGSRSEQLRRIGIAASKMKSLSKLWHQSHLALTTRLRLYMSLIVPILLYASETWTTTKLDLAHLQAFHMRCQRQILNIHWFDKVRNTEISRRTNLPHIGDLLQKRRHSLFGHIVRMHPSTPGHRALALCRDFSMNRRIPVGWKRPRGRPRTSWISQLKTDTGVPIATSWSRAGDRRLWKADATALKGYAVQ